LLVFDIFVDTLEARIASAKKKLLTPKQDIVLIIERGTMFDQLIFWKLQVDLGKKSADGMCDDAYMGIWKKWTRFVPSPLIIFFFQTSDIQTTMQRVKQRARAEELGHSFSDGENMKASTEEITNVGGLTLDYQKALLVKHREWFAEPVASPPFAKEGGIPCVHVNVDQAFHTDDNALENLAKDMAERIFLQINAHGVIYSFLCSQVLKVKASVSQVDNDVVDSLSSEKNAKTLTPSCINGTIHLKNIFGFNAL
jgi:hypothetical protein